MCECRGRQEVVGLLQQLSRRKNIGALRLWLTIIEAGDKGLAEYPDDQEKAVEYSKTLVLMALLVGGSKHDLGN